MFREKKLFIYTELILFVKNIYTYNKCIRVIRHRRRLRRPS